MRVPERFKEATLQSLDTRQYRPVIEYAKLMVANMREGKGLLLSGPPGVGKSWAMVALTRTAIIKHDKALRRFDYEFVTAPNMFDAIPAVPGMETTKSLDSRRGQQWVDTVASVPWLVINDLAKEYRGGLLAEQVAYKLGRILRERCERKLVTHITTNVPLKGENSLVSVYGESIVSLLSEMVSSYAINGADRRRGK